MLLLMSLPGALGHFGPVQNLLSHWFHCMQGGGRAGRRGVSSDSWVLPLWAALMGGVMGASAAGEMVSGPTSTAAGHPRLASGQKVMGTTSPPAAGFFEAVGSAATPGGPGSRANLHSLPVQPPLCAPVHVSLDVWMCGILQHPGMLGRATSVELWILY